MGETEQHLTACLVCDQLVTLPPLEAGEEAHCGRCGHLLTRRVANSSDKTIAFSIAALVLLACALYYPMLGFSAQGRSQTMTLLESGTALIENQQFILGTMVILLVIGVPLVLMILLLATTVGLRLRRSLSWLPPVARAFYHIKHWNMVEVYVIGVLVSLTKIASLATIELGIAFWALIGFAVCFILATNSIDRVALWRDIREASA